MENFAGSDGRIKYSQELERGSESLLSEIIGCIITYSVSNIMPGMRSYQIGRARRTKDTHTCSIADAICGTVDELGLAPSAAAKTFFELAVANHPNQPLSKLRRWFARVGQLRPGNPKQGAGAHYKCSSFAWLACLHTNTHTPLCGGRCITIIHPMCARIETNNFQGKLDVLALA